MNKPSSKAVKTFEELLKECSRQLIEEDGNTIINFILSVKNDGLITLSMLPYLALYCRSVQEFYGEKVIESSFDKRISDLRNGLKIYSGRYNKGREVTLNLDEQQNRTFKEMLKISFMKRWNIHYNLGVYFDAEGHIVGDTQMLSYFLNSSSTNINAQKTQAYEIGKILGSKVSFILNNLCELETIPIVNTIQSYPKYGYINMNTNRKCDFFIKSVDKELNLIILHILSTIGFVKNVLNSMLPRDNLWVLRIEYIVVHYAWSGLKKIKQHYENNNQINSTLIDDISIIIDSGESLFPSSFRNCMMHYDFFNKDNAVILEQYYDAKKPFYGLVESCFNGKSYSELTSILMHYVMELEKCLLSWFHIDIHKVKWDL